MRRRDAVSDTTFTGTMLFASPEAQDLTRRTMERLGALKAGDMARVVRGFRVRGEVPSREERQKPLMAQGLTFREARSIIGANDALWESHMALHDVHVKQWTEKRAQALSKGRHAYARSLERRLRKAEDHSITLGGRELFKRASRGDTRAKSEWRDRRLFWGAGGEGDRVGGNAALRVRPTGEVRGGRLIFEVLAKAPGSKGFTLLGTMVFKRPQAARAIMGAQEANRPVTAHLVKRGRRYRLHLTPNVPVGELLEPNPSLRENRRGGVDLNADHAAAVVVDATGNPVAHRVFPFQGTEEARQAARAVAAWWESRGVSQGAQENLRGLNQNRSARETGGESKGLRRMASQLPTAAFRDALTRNARHRGILVTTVSPRDTSKLTVEWPEALFGKTVHEKASYLIARRGLGLGLKRSREVLSTLQRMDAQPQPSAFAHGPKRVPLEGSGLKKTRGGPHDGAFLAIPF